MEVEEIVSLVFLFAYWHLKHSINFACSVEVHLLIYQLTLISCAFLCMDQDNCVLYKICLRKRENVSILTLLEKSVLLCNTGFAVCNIESRN
jgi:hypothetical protein